MISMIQGFGTRLILQILVSVSFINITGSKNVLGPYKNTKCGCDLDTSERVRPQCLEKTNNTEFQEFEAVNLASCSDWFLEGYDWTLVDEDSGTVNVTFLLSSQVKLIKYEVDLKIIEDPVNSTHRVLLPNHSSVEFKVSPKHACESVLPFSFSFLYTGTYQLEVFVEFPSSPAQSISSRCRSRPFNITSRYQKMYLNNLEPTFYSRYRPQTQELIITSDFGNFPAGLHPHSTLVMLNSRVDMSLPDCSASGNKVAKYFLLGREGYCCDCLPQKQDTQISCPCSWLEDTKEMKCTFPNVTNGNYCVIVGFEDPRCKSDTIWTKNSSCSWSYNFTAIGNTTSTVVTVLPKSSPYKWYITIPFIILGIILIICIILYIYKPKCLKKLTHGFNSYTSSSLVNQPDRSAISWLIQDEKINFPCILLLYPRDCEPFMEAMEMFRLYLKSTNCKVCDPWDEEIYDEVVESLETWTLSYIANKNVKIVIVLSECSKRFEESFLKHTSLEYVEPQALDSIFLQSLSTVHQYFAKRFDSYQRIFVVKLDGTSPMNFDFITPATVYTIPHHVPLLMRDLLSGNHTDATTSSKFLRLEEAIRGYKSFKNANDDYLSHLLNFKKDFSV